MFALWATTFWDLPRVPLQRIPILPNEIDVVLFGRKDADGDVLVVHHAVDARLAVRMDDPVFAHGYPWVVIDSFR